MGKISQMNIVEDKNAVKRPDAVDLFTDREDPQEAFERKLRVINQYRTKASAAMCFYGMGGVGKTALLSKLQRVIENKDNSSIMYARRLYKEMDCYSASIDFNDASNLERRKVLIRLRNQLEKYGFDFFLLDYALVSYARKAGDDSELKDKSMSLIIEKSPWLEALVNGVGVIPVIGWASNAIQGLDKAGAATRDAISSFMNKKANADEWARISGYDKTEILDHLHEWFIADMQENMSKSEKPLVIFLDTFEKYIKPFYKNDDDVSALNDKWLYFGPNSTIRRIPGVLWVIMSRDKLDWSDESDFWDEVQFDNATNSLSEEQKEEIAENSFEQHLLGDLSSDDVKKFLFKAGIEEENIRAHIIETSCGTPLYLDLCVEQYYAVKAAGRQPDTADFGKDKDSIVNRYLRGLSDANKEMSYLLATLDSWSTQLVQDVCERVEGLKYYTFKNYTEYLQHSFVIKKEDEIYYLHEHVKNACLEDADSEFVKKIREALVEIIEEKIDSPFDANYLGFVKRYLDIIFANDNPCQYMLEKWMRIHAAINNICAVGDFKTGYMLSKEIYERVRELSDGDISHRSELEFACLAQLSRDACECGNIKEASSLIECINYNQDNTAVYQDIYYLALETISITLDRLGNYKDSLMLSEQCYEYWKNNLGENHPDTLCSLSNVASSYAAVGDYRTAINLTEYCYRQRCESLGEEHPYTLDSLNNLANDYDRIGEYTKSVELKERGYELRKKVLGEEHPDTLSSLNNLSVSYGDIGEYEKALELSERSYELMGKILGEDHPDTLACLNNLAIRYSDIGDFVKSHELKKLCYELRTKKFGEEHPDTLGSLNNLANSYSCLGDYTKALELKKQCYEARKRVLGEDHPETIISLCNLADNYGSVGEYEISINLTEQCHEQMVQILGENHPDTLTCLSNLAILYGYVEDYAKSLELTERCYELRKQKLGENHPDTLRCLSNLANCYSDLEDYNKSLELSEQCYGLMVQILGAEHPDTLKALNNLSNNYGYVGNFIKSKELIEQCYKLKVKVYGENHPETLSSLVNLALSYEDLGDYAKAHEILEPCTEQLKNTLGENHPDTLNALENLDTLNKLLLQST